jgi:hypothetical protein
MMDRADEHVVQAPIGWPIAGVLDTAKFASARIPDVVNQVFSADAFAADKPAGSLFSWIGSAARRIATWADTCADYYAAAAMYEQLSALSDAELARRGLSRATLARDVRAACDRDHRH